VGNALAPIETKSHPERVDTSAKHE